MQLTARYGGAPGRRRDRRPPAGDVQPPALLVGGRRGGRGAGPALGRRPFTRPKLSRELPACFVATKPYFSGWFPETPTNRRSMVELLGSMADSVDVVLLSPGLGLDQYAEMDLAGHKRMCSPGGLAARTNLAEQTRVLALADALVSTYGGQGVFLACRPSASSP